MTRLEVFEDMRAAREAAKATQGGTLYLTQAKHISPSGVETYYGSANTLDEVYRYAGIEFQAIEYHCDPPTECRAYLESRKRRPHAMRTVVTIEPDCDDEEASRPIDVEGGEHYVCLKQGEDWIAFPTKNIEDMILALRKI